MTQQRKSLGSCVERKMASPTAGEYVTKSSVLLMLHTHREVADVEYPRSASHRKKAMT